jgi:type VI secretion system protein ImpA
MRLEGVATLPEGLRLMHGLLARYWDELHPMPDEGDAYARINALNEMASLAGMLGDLRDSLVLSDRALGELRGRDIEVALGTLEPRSGDATYSRSTVEQMLGEATQSKPSCASFPLSALARVGELQQLMRDRVGYAAAPGAAAPDHDAHRHPRSRCRASRPGPRPTMARAPEGRRTAKRPARGGGRGLSGSIESRNDALRAIDMVCEYLERTEPTNPAQLLLRRARRLVNKNFVELVRELAPESLNEVARVMGISAEELSALQAQE